MSKTFQSKKKRKFFLTNWHLFLTNFRETKEWRITKATTTERSRTTNQPTSFPPNKQPPTIRLFLHRTTDYLPTDHWPTDHRFTDCLKRHLNTHLNEFDFLKATHNVIIKKWHFQKNWKLISINWKVFTCSNLRTT